MAPVTEQEVPSREGHGGHGQREQDDAVKEHRGNRCFAERLHGHVQTLGLFVFLDFWIHSFPEVQGCLTGKRQIRPEGGTLLSLCVTLAVNDVNAQQS